MRHDVLIVGAGPTGLVLALWLNRMGVSVRIVAKADGPGTQSRALAVHARTLELYGQLDLAGAVVSEGYEVGGVNLWVGGEKRAHVSLTETGAAHTRYPFLQIFPQDRHERLLVERLQSAGICVEWATELIDFEQGEAGVTARLRLPDGSERSCEAQFLAGCDGAGSIVRKQLGMGFPGDTYEQTFYVADVEANGPPMNGELNIDLDDSDFLAIFPLDGGSRARLVGTVREDAATAGTHDFETINRKAAASLGINVTKVNWFSSYRVHHRVVDQFRAGRVFLLGDAAHVHSPAGGQGMNTGIGDAINLAWKIAMVTRGAAEDKVLDSYQEERRAFARKLVRTTDQAFSLATSEGALARFVRTRIVPLVMPTALQLDWLRDWAFRTVSQLEISYRGDALSEGEAGEIHGGDRLPWLELGEGRTNYEGFSSLSWQFHVYGYAGHALEDWCRAQAIPLHVFPWRPGFEEAGVERDAVYVIRPDCYVGLADGEPSTERLTAYFGSRGIRLPLSG